MHNYFLYGLGTKLECFEYNSFFSSSAITVKLHLFVCSKHCLSLKWTWKPRINGKSLGLSKHAITRKLQKDNIQQCAPQIFLRSIKSWSSWSCLATRRWAVQLPLKEETFLPFRFFFWREPFKFLTTFEENVRITFLGSSCS